MASEYTFTLDCPDQVRGVKNGLLSLNEERRLHHMHTAQIIKYWRKETADAVKPLGWPRLNRAHVLVRVHKTTNRKYDAANLYPVAKAIGDGCTDAGLWVDDDNAHVLGPDIRAGEKADTARVVVTITELEDQS